MDPVELNKMVEKAKADASATGASKPAPPKDDPTVKSAGARSADSLLEVSDEDLDHMIQEIMDLGREEDSTGVLKKQAELERGRHIKVAKLLAAMDVFAGASR